MAKKKDPYTDIKKSIDIQCFIESIKDGFKDVEDPRLLDNQSYPLMSLFRMNGKSFLMKTP